MPKVKSKDVIRVGDKVKIKEPLEFIRCGYNPSHAQWCEIVDEQDGPAVQDFCNLMKVYSNKAYHKVISALAYGKVQEEAKKGGQARAITTKIFCTNGNHWQFPEIGEFVEVIKTKVVKTGIHYPSSGGFDYWGECNYEPGYLSEEKTHKVLRVRSSQYNVFWILAEHVEKVAE